MTAILFSIRLAALAGVAIGAGAGNAFAHGSGQPFILLLPTEFYIASGTAAAALTVVGLALLPAKTAEFLFKPFVLCRWNIPEFRSATSAVFFLLLSLLLITGIFGSRDPLANPLPLFIWNIWWIIVPLLQFVAGDLWAWINPWRAPAEMVRYFRRRGAFLRLRWGQAPAIALLLAFAAFMLADIAPADPARLAYAVAGYCGATFLAMIIFGADRWLRRGECFTILLRFFARLSPFKLSGGKLLFGFPGWRLIKESRGMTATSGLFALAMLASGSFDGLNETFLWLDFLGINPLEFPGRSAVGFQTVAGLLAFYAGLVSIFAASVYAGAALAGRTDKFRQAFIRLAPCVLPIALGYHFAHFLTALLVNSQYAFASLTDPFGTGRDLLGIGDFHVTTGFFNTRDSVRAIWLSQGGAVLFGHLLAFVLSHAAGLSTLGNRKETALALIPISTLMILYTFFGLWLLASPKGA